MQRSAGGGRSGRSAGGRRGGGGGGTGTQIAPTLPLIHTYAKDGSCVDLTNYIATNPTTDINSTCTDGKTALHYAAVNGHVDCIRCLLLENADINIKDRFKNIPYYYAQKFAKDNNSDFSCCNELKLQPIHIYARDGLPVDLTNYIDTNPTTDINSTCTDGKTALHYAAVNGHIDCIKYLLSKNADTNIRDKLNYRPYYYAKVYATKNNDNRCYNIFLKPIHICARDGNLDELTNYIDTNPTTDIYNTCTDGKTALHYAAEYGHKACLEYLLENGANPNLDDNNNFPAYYYASKFEEENGNNECRLVLQPLLKNEETSQSDDYIVDDYKFDENRLNWLRVAILITDLGAKLLRKIFRKYYIGLLNLADSNDLDTWTNSFNIVSLWNDGSFCGGNAIRKIFDYNVKLDINNNIDTDPTFSNNNPDSSFSGNRNNLNGNQSMVQKIQNKSNNLGEYSYLPTKNSGPISNMFSFQIDLLHKGEPDSWDITLLNTLVSNQACMNDIPQIIIDNSKRLNNLRNCKYGHIPKTSLDELDADVLLYELRSVLLNLEPNHDDRNDINRLITGPIEYNRITEEVTKELDEIKKRFDIYKNTQDFLDKYSPGHSIDTKASEISNISTIGNSTRYDSVANNEPILELEIKIMKKKNKRKTNNSFASIGSSYAIKSSTKQFIGGRKSIVDDNDNNTLECNANNWYIGLVSTRLNLSKECEISYDLTTSQWNIVNLNPNGNDIEIERNFVVDGNIISRKINKLGVVKSKLHLHDAIYLCKYNSTSDNKYFKYKISVEECIISNLKVTKEFKTVEVDKNVSKVLIELEPGLKVGFGDFEIMDKLPIRGAFGSVFKASGNRFVAIKTPKYNYNSAYIKRMENEMLVLTKLVGHPHIINLIHLDFHSEQNIPLLFFPWYETDLYKLIKDGNLNLLVMNSVCSNNVLQNLFNILEIMLRITDGIRYIHLNNIIHSDIKPANILIKTCPIFDLSICDFNTSGINQVDFDNNYTEIDATNVNEVFKPSGYTMKYRSPEQKNKEEITYSTDIWSMGIILLEMLTRCNELNLEDCNNLEDVDNIPHLQWIKFIKDFDQGSKILNLLQKCLKVKPEERIKAYNINNENETFIDELIDIMKFEEGFSSRCVFGTEVSTSDKISSIILKARWYTNVRCSYFESIKVYEDLIKKYSYDNCENKYYNCAMEEYVKLISCIYYVLKDDLEIFNKNYSISDTVLLQVNNKYNLSAVQKDLIRNLIGTKYHEMFKNDEMFKSITSNIYMELLKNKLQCNINMNLQDCYFGEYPAIVMSIFCCKFDSETEQQYLESIFLNNKNILDCVNLQDKHGSTSIHVAVIENNIECLEELVKVEGINVNIQDKNGYTVIHYAVIKNKFEFLQLLVNVNGLDINIQAKYGSTAFHIAVKENNIKCLRPLLDIEGIDVNIQDIYSCTAIHIAVMDKNVECLEELLKVKGIKVNIQDKNGITAIHASVKTVKNVKCLKALLKVEGKDVNIQDKNGITAIHIAVMEKNVECLEELLKVKGIKVNIQDKNGITAIHIAVMEKNVKCLEELLKVEGIDVNIQDKNGITAIHIAVMDKNVECLEELLKVKGIKVNIQDINYAKTNHFSKGFKLLTDKLNTCFVCDKVASKHCSNCDTRYCSKECQVNDWKNHKKKCKKK
jgi:ankyrin repeat protein/serine/threonine protein kinase